MSQASWSDSILDAAKASGILYAETFFPEEFLQEAVVQLADTSASLYFSTTDLPEQAGDRAMFVGAFIWAYRARQRALQVAPTATMHDHSIGAKGDERRSV